MARRMAYRSWKYLHRTERPFWAFHPVFWRQARAWLPIFEDHADFIERCGQVFESAEARVAGRTVGADSR